MTIILNDADNGGTQDILSDYYQVNGEISFEYFFSNQVSFKVLTGTDKRNYKYSNSNALEIIANPDYGPTYFNGFESYSGLIVGGELNWIF